MSKIEQLASELHDIYQKEAKRQGDHRHFDKYEDLAEPIKEYDRVLARYILDREKQQAEQIESMKKILKKIKSISNHMPLSYRSTETDKIAKIVRQALAATPQKGQDNV